MANVDIFLPGAGSNNVPSAYQGNMGSVECMRKVIDFSKLTVPAADVVRYMQLTPGMLLLGAVFQVAVPDTGSSTRTASLGYDGAATAFGTTEDMKTAGWLGDALAAPVPITTLTHMLITTIVSEQLTNLVIVANVFVGKVIPFDPEEVL